jgi:hypothetical protein
MTRQVARATHSPAHATWSSSSLLRLRRVKVTYDKQGQELIARAIDPVTTAVFIALLPTGPCRLPAHVGRSYLSSTSPPCSRRCAKRGSWTAPPGAKRARFGTSYPVLHPKM